MIKFVEYGTALKAGNIIYMNRAFLDDKELYTEILDHELNHPPQIKVIKDILLDLQPRSLKYYRFILTHPKTWTALSPIDIYDNTLYINLSQTLLYSIILGLTAYIMIT